MGILSVLTVDQDGSLAVCINKTREKEKESYRLTLKLQGSSQVSQRSEPSKTQTDFQVALLIFQSSQNSRGTKFDANNLR